MLSSSSHSSNKSKLRQLEVIHHYHHFDQNTIHTGLPAGYVCDLLLYGAKVKGGQYACSDSEAAFTRAAAIGYVFDSFEAGVRCQSVYRDGESSGFIGFRICYDFSSGGK